MDQDGVSNVTRACPCPLSDRSRRPFLFVTVHSYPPRYLSRQTDSRPTPGIPLALKSALSTLEVSNRSAPDEQITTNLTANLTSTQASNSLIFLTSSPSNQPTAPTSNLTRSFQQPHLITISAHSLTTPNTPRPLSLPTPNARNPPHRRILPLQLFPTPPRHHQQPSPIAPKPKSLKTRTRTPTPVVLNCAKDTQRSR